MKGATLEDWLELVATDWFPAAATSDLLGPPPPRNMGGGPGQIHTHVQQAPPRIVYVPVRVDDGGPYGMLRA